MCATELLLQPTISKATKATERRITALTRLASACYGSITDSWR